MQKKFALLGNCFSDLFNWGRNLVLKEFHVYYRTDITLLQIVLSWIEVSFDLKRRVKDFWLFCMCSSLWFGIFRPIDRSLFEIFQVWLLINVPYVSESEKLPVPSRHFGLGACDIIMTSLESWKLVWTVMETVVNDSFSWGTSKTTFSNS